MDDYRKFFVENVKKNYPKNKDKILDALDFATACHDGILRKSGEPYIIHPIAVSQILMDNYMDYSTIIAGLLHDVVEDTEITLEQIEQRYGKTVAKLVDGLTKIDKITMEKENLKEVDSIKRLLLAMGDDVRVIFIKLADRLHNMRTVSFLGPIRQIEFAMETQELFIPIAERIGVRKIRSELQALTFACLHKESYEKIKAEHDHQIQKHSEKINSIQKKMLSILRKNKIKATVSWRPENYYSIFKKTKLQGVNKTYGLALYKIIVPKLEDCYKALGVIHQVFKPVPGQIKDYIASPKANGYQSLHSVVLSEDNNITLNVMIRTADMDRVCEYGILALGRKKDPDENFNKNLEKFNRLKEIIIGEKKESDSESEFFVDAIKTDLFSNVTWVFTPKFKPIKIESNYPTAIDFAYTLHSEIGNSAVGAVINGKKASLASTLKNGDIVEIITEEGKKTPSRDWIAVAKTYYTRKRIREYFSKNLTKENIKNGKLILENELKNNGYENFDIEKLYQLLKVDFHLSSIEDMFASIACGGIKISQILSYLIVKNDENNALISSPVCVQDESFATSVVFSKCCCPILGDDIVALKVRNSISIHTRNCLNLKKIESNKILQADWKKNVDSLFDVNLKIVAKDEISFGSKLLGAISKLGIDISKITAKQRNGDCEFEITLKLKNTTELDKVIMKILNVEGVKTINRSFD